MWICILVLDQSLIKCVPSTAYVDKFSHLIKNGFERWELAAYMNHWLFKTQNPKEINNKNNSTLLRWIQTFRLENHWIWITPNVFFFNKIVISLRTQLYLIKMLCILSPDPQQSPNVHDLSFNANMMSNFCFFLCFQELLNQWVSHTESCLAI